MSLRLLFFLSFLFTSTASAHFGMVIPSTNTVDQSNKTLHLVLSFSHPFEKIGMDLVRPEKFYVVHNKRHQDITSNLKESLIMNHQAWVADYSVKYPGTYQFVMEPSPYWEPSEDVFIVHYTKTLSAAFDSDEGWGEAIGLPTEIIPLTRPFGNYAGNIFTGQVLVNGKPAVNSEVEVELYNREIHYTAPTPFHITQVIKTDKNGVFSFICPVEGWWGFAALSMADYTLEGPSGKQRDVELGAVLWVYVNKHMESYN